MKRLGNIWEKIISHDNLQLALRKAARGKRSRRAVKRVEANSEFYLELLHNTLKNGDFVCSHYDTKMVYEPKARRIFILPFFPDRVVQHALLNVLEPYWDSLFIYDSYACRQGKGQHRGMLRAMQYVRQYKYVLKCDISKFYPNIRHDILKGILRKKIKDQKVLALLDSIIDSPNGNEYSEPGKNVPIGSTISQWFGNLYLNELDMVVKQDLRIKGYIRYSDDFVIFADDKTFLHDVRYYLAQWLKTKLDFKFSKAEIFPVSHGVDYLGYRCFKDYVLVRKSTAKRLLKRLRYVIHGCTDEYLNGFVASVSGWISWANTWNLRHRFMEILRQRTGYEKVFGFCQGE